MTKHKKLSQALDKLLIALYRDLKMTKYEQSETQCEPKGEEMR